MNYLFNLHSSGVFHWKIKEGSLPCRMSQTSNSLCETPASHRGGRMQRFETSDTKCDHIFDPIRRFLSVYLPPPVCKYLVSWTLLRLPGQVHRSPLRLGFSDALSLGWPLCIMAVRQLRYFDTLIAMWRSIIFFFKFKFLSRLASIWTGRLVIYYTST